MYPFKIMSSVFYHRKLIIQLSKKEIKAKYKGSYLGFLWSLITPIIMLLIYTLVFGVIFQSKWDIEVNNTHYFAMVLFIGLTTFNIFSEVIVGSVNIISNNVNYVKKVIFPLEILPIVVLCTSLFQNSINFLIIIAFSFLFLDIFSISILILPFYMLPFLLSIIGISWIISSVGVYIKDLNQVIGSLISGLLFLSPVFYPLEAIPDKFKPYFDLNPLTIIISDVRRIVLFGEIPSVLSWCGALIISVLILSLGYKFFNSVKRGFSDVL